LLSQEFPLAVTPTRTPIAPTAAVEPLSPLLLHRVSWGAIFAGAVIALVVQMILNMAGLGIGMATLDPTGNDTPSLAGLSTGAGLWWVGSGIVASLIGGFLAGRLSGKPSAGISGYHGLISWAVTTLVIVYLLTSAAGSLVGGAFGGLSNVIGGAGSAIGGAAQTAAQTAAPSLTKLTNPLDGIENQVRRTSGGQDPAALRDTAAQAVRAYLSGDAAEQAQAEARATDALAKAQGISPEEAKTQVQTYRKQYEQAAAEAKQKAIAAAETTRKAAAQGSLYAALALVLGALAAFLGGRFGAVSPARADGIRRD
jgi:hypothetical protein